MTGESFELGLIRQIGGIRAHQQVRPGKWFVCAPYVSQERVHLQIFMLKDQLMIFLFCKVEAEVIYGLEAGCHNGAKSVV